MTLDEFQGSLGITPAAPDDRSDMGRSVIIVVNRKPQAFGVQDGGHDLIIRNPSALDRSFTAAIAVTDGMPAVPSRS
jgi:hypothetical protein